MHTYINLHGTIMVGTKDFLSFCYARKTDKGTHLSNYFRVIVCTVGYTLYIIQLLFPTNINTTAHPRHIQN
jgi:hypothetical protein